MLTVIGIVNYRIKQHIALNIDELLRRREHINLTGS